jgi:Ca2+-binding RTX toxin-like protein
VAASDRISGGDGEDILIGDNALILAPLVDHGEFDPATYHNDVLELYGRVRSLEWLLDDALNFVEHTYSQTLTALVGEALELNPSGKKPKKDDLIDVDLTPIAARGDEVDGGDGADLIIGDDALLLIPVTSHKATREEASDTLGITKDADKALETALKDDDKARDKELKDHEKVDHKDPHPLVPKKKDLDLIPWRLSVPVRTGNDHLNGDGGEDWIIGDLGVVVWPSELDLPTSKKQVKDLEKDADRLLKDLDERVADLGWGKRHGHGHGHHHHHHLHDGHWGSDGHSGGGSDADLRWDDDVINGGDGNDLVFGDDALLRPEFVEDVGLVGYSAHAGDHFRFGSDGHSDGGDDEIHGNDGDDILLGNGGDDVIFGDDGDDLLIGGKGKDVLDGGEGKDKAKKGSDGGSDGKPDRMRTLSNPWINEFAKDLAGFRSQILPDQPLWLDFGGSDSA